MVRRSSPRSGAFASVHLTSTRGPSSWKITEVADLRGARTLVIHGELDIATAPELVDLLERLRRHGHAVTLDLAEVTFMDSTGLTTIMDAHTQAIEDGWSFSVSRASPAVRRVFDLAGVGRILDE
ncbi:MAG TPA: STAS domain-containing protein [Solirubrobacter sp.]|nr:STAS domain-containing protein [Solirubrobacter sp.]